MAFDGREAFPVGVSPHAGNRTKKPLGVGVEGVIEQPFDRGGFDDLTGVEDYDVVGDLSHDPEVVGDEFEGGPGGFLKVAHQSEDLGLNGDVQGGGGFVGDHQVGVAGQRLSDQNPLAHAPAELVGIVAGALGGSGDLDFFEHPDGFDPSFASRHLAVEPEDFGHLVPHRVEWVQGGHRFLEDHADLPSPVLEEGGLVQVEQIGPLKENPARFDAARRGGDQAQYRQRGHAFPTAGFADDPEGSSPFERVGDTIHGARHPVAQVEIDAQILNLQEGRMGGQGIAGGLGEDNRIGGIQGDWNHREDSSRRLFSVDDPPRKLLLRKKARLKPAVKRIRSWKHPA